MLSIIRVFDGDDRRESYVKYLEDLVKSLKEHNAEQCKIIESLNEKQKECVNSEDLVKANGRIRELEAQLEILNVTLSTLRDMVNSKAAEYQSRLKTADDALSTALKALRVVKPLVVIDERSESE